MKKIITLSCLMLLCSFGTEVRFNRHGIYIEEYSGLRNDQ